MGGLGLLTSPSKLRTCFPHIQLHGAHLEPGVEVIGFHSRTGNRTRGTGSPFLGIGNRITRPIGWANGSGGMFLGGPIVWQTNVFNSVEANQERGKTPLLSSLSIHEQDPHAQEDPNKCCLRLRFPGESIRPKEMVNATLCCALPNPTSGKSHLRLLLTPARCFSDSLVMETTKGQVILVEEDEAPSSLEMVALPPAHSS